MKGFISINNPNKHDRTSFLQALGGILSPNGDLIYIPGELPQCIQHLSHEWQPVAQVPDWAK
jgi:hypothetical protein